MSTNFPDDEDDGEDEDEMMFGLDLEGIDEQTSAIHCLGNLSLNCGALMHQYSGP